MSANIIPAAQKMNADLHSVTSAEPTTPTAQGPQFSELLTGVGSEYGGLSHLFGEGAAALKPVVTSVTVPTDSTRGKLGGLVPALRSVVSPGPTIQRTEHTLSDVITEPMTGTQLPGQAPANKPTVVATIRRWLKV